MFTMEKFKEMKRAVPCCFYMRETACVDATGVRFHKNGITMLLPESENPRILYVKEESGCDAVIVPVPDKVRKDIERFKGCGNYKKGKRTYLKLFVALVSRWLRSQKKSRR